MAVLKLGFLIEGHAQISQEFLFYSPSEEHLGFLTFVNDKQHVFTNNEYMILMNTEDNLHLDTLKLEGIGLSGLIQFIVVMDDKYISVGGMRNFALIKVEDRQLTLEKKTDSGELKKNGLKQNIIVLLPEGFFTADYKRSRKGDKLSLSFYSNDYSQLQEAEIDMGNYESKTINSMGIAYPHNMNYADGKVFLNEKGYGKFISFDTKTGNRKVYKLSSIISEEEAGEVFYDHIKETCFFVKYASLEEDKRARVYISQLNLADMSNVKLNDATIELRNIRGGIQNGKLIMTGEFMGETAYYLIPVQKLHELN